MSLTNFQKHFDNTYQEIFQKALVAKTIMNTRFEAKLKFGESVERFTYDISAVQVRSTVRGSASTIDSVTDGSELLTVNLEKEAVFHISDGEVSQAGPLNPGAVIGGQIGLKVAIDLDARSFAEVQNALFDFDTGDLTTLASNGTPITLSSTTVPQMTTRMAAKLRAKNNQMVTSNMCFVVDAYAASDIEQYLMGKDIDIAGAVFKNGYAGLVRNAVLYVSENLTGEAVMGMATQPTAADSVTINGVTFQFVATLAAAGDLHIGTAVDDTRANMVAAFNDIETAIAEATETGYQLVSAADQETWVNLKITATNDDTANTATIVAVGSGRLTVAETFTDGTDAWDTNFIHTYFGKKGAIDLVVQDLKKVDMRKTDDRRGTNVFSNYLAGIKTFADGAKKFLDVHIAA